MECPCFHTRSLAFVHKSHRGVSSLWVELHTLESVDCHDLVGDACDSSANLSRTQLSPFRSSRRISRSSSSCCCTGYRRRRGFVFHCTLVPAFGIVGLRNGPRCLALCWSCRLGFWRRTRRSGRASGKHACSAIARLYWRRWLCGLWYWCRLCWCWRWWLWSWPGSPRRWHSHWLCL